MSCSLLNVFIDVLALYVAWLRMPFHKYIETDVILNPQRIDTAVEIAAGLIAPPPSDPLIPTK